MGPRLPRDCEKFIGRPGLFRRLLRPRLVQADPPRPQPAQPLHRPRRPAGRPLIWQDPVPAGTTGSDVEAVKARDRGIGPVGRRHGRHPPGIRLRTFRQSDLRGRCQRRAHPACPQKDWAGNEPERLEGGAAAYCRCWTRSRRKPAYRLRRHRAGGQTWVLSRPQRPPARRHRAVPAGSRRRDGRDDGCRELLGAGAAGRWLSKLAQGTITSSAPRS